jgi:NAD(P)-dependent dehydrogenase (short-subunit alcohol dehydrogenase family)
MRTLIITGGSRGIGKATALSAARRGWAVAIGYVSNADAATDTVNEIVSAGGMARAFPCNVEIETDIINLFDEAQRAFGPVYGVVANAGILAPSMKLSEMSADRLRRITTVNLVGALLTAREAVRRMAISAGGNGGSIVFVSSAAARLGSPGEYVDYAASKGGVDTLAVGLAKEVAADGIRVNAVRPGLITTDIHASGGQPDRAERLGVRMPMKRPGTAAEVANAINWLLSDEASYVTGDLLDVAGGR